MTLTHRPVLWTDSVTVIVWFWVPRLRNADATEPSASRRFHTCQLRGVGVGDGGGLGGEGGGAGGGVKPCFFHVFHLASCASMAATEVTGR